MSMKIPARSLKKAICYTYLLAYCPPEHIQEMKAIAQPMRVSAAELANMEMDEFPQKAAPQVSRHIVAFHQDTRDPGEDWVAELAGRIASAEGGAEEADAFQRLLGLVSRLPQRAKSENRLHHRRGCRFCGAPCHYGYFSLVSEPDFALLQGFYEHELSKPVEDMKPVLAAKSFALSHIVGLLGAVDGTLHIHHLHLANLAYCLLSLATAKSRLPFPEEQLKLFQQANQYFSFTQPDD